MKAWTKACWASLIAVSLAAVVHADEAAIVRISDRPAPVPDPGPGASATSPGPIVNGTATGASCDGGACAGAGGDVGGCYLNPTRGFRPYAAAPVYREAVVYYRYWPDKWYGDPNFNLRPMFPQVYMPTDTTQQGFYYARVPQWMPNPNMYPPAPRPEDWHRHVVYAGGAGGAYAGASGGVSMGSGGGMEMGTPVPASVQPIPAQPSTPSVPASPPPAAPPQPSAMIQGGSVQPAAATGERHWLLEDLMHNFSRNRDPQVAPATQVTPATQVQAAPESAPPFVPPAPAGPQ